MISMKMIFTAHMHMTGHGTVKFIQQKLYRQLSTKFKVKALCGIRYLMVRHLVLVQVLLHMGVKTPRDSRYRSSHCQRGSEILILLCCRNAICLGAI